MERWQLIIEPHIVPVEIAQLLTNLLMESLSILITLESYIVWDVDVFNMFNFIMYLCDALVEE